MKVRIVLLNIVAAAAGFATVAQAAISVTSTGTGTNTFDTAPAATEWSTLAVTTSGAPTYENNVCPMDANIRSGDASAITTTLPITATVPPATSSLAQWNSQGLYLQTRPTGSDYTLLMATLQNNSGGTLTALSVSYDFGMDGIDTTETIKKHRAFFSLTGAPGSWQFIPEFSGAEPGPLTATLNLGTWANGSTLYILWADDNGSNPDGGYTIDNFSAIGTTPSTGPTVTITSISIPPIPPSPPGYCWTNFAGSLTVNGDADGTGDAALFTQIYGLDINGAGDTLFAADRGTGKIKKVTVPGAVVTTLASGFSLVELAVNKVNGNVYFPDLADGALKKLVPPNYNTATVVDAGPGWGNGLAVDSAADTVYASKTGENQIYSIANAGSASPGPATLFVGDGTGATTDGTLLGCSINAPMGGVVVGTGASAILYWASRVPGSIRKIDIAADSVTTVAGGGPACHDDTGTAAGFDQPHNVVIGPDGNLYVADQTSGLVRRVTLPDGVVTTIGGVCQGFAAVDGCGTDAIFGQLGQIAIDSSGTIWAGDRSGVGSARARVIKGVVTAGDPGGPGTDLQIDFTGPTGYPDCSSGFTLQSSSAVEGPYADVAASIATLAPGSFRATIAPNGDTQFYRVSFVY